MTEKASEGGGAGGGLTDIQRQAIDLLAQGTPHAEVARALGVKQTLLGMWQAWDTEFIAALNERRERNTHRPGTPLPEPPLAEAPPAPSAPQLPPEPATVTQEQPPQPLVTTRMASFS